MTFTPDQIRQRADFERGNRDELTAQMLEAFADLLLRSLAVADELDVFHGKLLSLWGDIEDCEDCGDIGHRPCGIHGSESIARFLMGEPFSRENEEQPFPKTSTLAASLRAEEPYRVGTQDGGREGSVLPTGGVVGELITPAVPSLSALLARVEAWTLNENDVDAIPLICEEIIPALEALVQAEAAEPKS